MTMGKSDFKSFLFQDHTGYTFILGYKSSESHCLKGIVVTHREGVGCMETGQGVEGGHTHTCSHLSSSPLFAALYLVR